MRADLASDAIGPAGVAPDPAFLHDVLQGLAQPQKAVPARWFYDRAGSELFEEITRLPEYYPTRTEAALLGRHAGEVGRLVGPSRAVVEFGSGSSAKTPALLSQIDPAAYVPIDISGDFLRHSAAELQARFPGLAVRPVEANFMNPVSLPADLAHLPKLGFFPGSTIGNLVPRSGVTLLRGMIDTLGVGAHLLIGMDRVKGEDVVVPAYDDAAGVTARFNLNLLHRINRELDADIPVDRFAHEARWNENWSRIEMHLVAREAVAFTIAGRPFRLSAGETIHTENSHKYDARSARQLLASGGWTPVAEWADEAGLFSMILAEAKPEPVAP